MKPVPGLLIPEAESHEPAVRLPCLLMKPECPKGLSDVERMRLLTDHILQGGSSNSGVPASFGDRRKLCEAMAKNPELRLEYEHAMRLRADRLAEEIVDIADGDDDPQKAKNRISARTWWASKIHPRRYSDRLELGLHGELSAAAALAEAKSRVRQGDVIDAEIVVQPMISDSTRDEVAKLDS